MPLHTAIIRTAPALNHMPNLVVYFNDHTARGYPLNDKGYHASYMRLFRRASTFFNVYVVRGKKSYQGAGVFKGGYQYAGGKLKRVHALIQATVLYDKGRLQVEGGDDWMVVNRKRVSRLMGDKFVTYRLFSHLMKKKIRVRSKRACARALKHIRGEMAVFKPVDGFGGNGVVITPKDELLKKLKQYDGIIEEFIDTSHGIPGLTEGCHDLRMTIMDGKIVQTYIRIPRKGSLLANIAQGGSMQEIPLRKLPSRARGIARTVDKKLACMGHRVYSVDVGFEKRKPYMIELNGEPGLPYPQWKRYYHAWHEGVINVFRACVRDLEKRKK